MAESNFINYKLALEKFLDALGTTHSKYHDVWSLGSQLNENIEDSRIDGNTADLVSDRRRILRQLNRISRGCFGKNFDAFYPPDPITDSGQSFTNIPDPSSTVNEGTGEEADFFDLDKDEQTINKIEHLCYNRGFTDKEINILLNILRKAPMSQEKKVEKDKGGRKVNPEDVEGVFLSSSQILGQYIVRLEKYHAEWSYVTVADDLTTQSIKLLRKMQQQVLKTKLYVDKVSNSKIIELETKEMLNSVLELRKLLLQIDQNLLAGGIPYTISNELDRHYSDIIYYGSKYLLNLHYLATGNKKNNLLQ